MHIDLVSCSAGIRCSVDVAYVAFEEVAVENHVNISQRTMHL